MALIAEALASFLVLVGAAFLFVGSFGLAKLPDLLRRLHGPTKATTLGIGAILIASMIHFAGRGDLSIHEFLITVFLFLTAPVSAQMIAKAHILRSEARQRDVPPDPNHTGWGASIGPQRGGPEGADAHVDGRVHR